MKTLFLLAIVYCSLADQAFADKSRTGWWFGGFNKAQLSSSWNGWLETQVRNSLENGRVDQILFRAGGLYTVRQHELGILGGVIQTGSVLERRYTLQHGISYLQNDSKKLSHRLRLEWRDFADSADDALRFRYLLRYSQALMGREAIIWNELFINFSDESKNDQGSIERNRLFIGSQVKLGESKFEVGYLNQAIFRGKENTIEHMAVAYWIF